MHNKINYKEKGFDMYLWQKVKTWTWAELSWVGLCIKDLNMPETYNTKMKKCLYNYILFFVVFARPTSQHYLTTNSCEFDAWLKSV